MLVRLVVNGLVWRDTLGIFESRYETGAIRESEVFDSWKWKIIKQSLSFSPEMGQ